MRIVSGELAYLRITTPAPTIIHRDRRESEKISFGYQKVVRAAPDLSDAERRKYKVSVHMSTALSENVP
jgi:hypothetical protein